MVPTPYVSSSAFGVQPESRRIAWITPDFPPDRGGVSDHSQLLVEALRAAGHDVLVFARPQKRGFGQLDAELRAHRPDVIVVAYVPLAYAPRTGGLAPEFALWCVRLRARWSCRTILLAHEASLPAAYLWRRRELKLATLATLQVAQFRLLSNCFDWVLFSNEGTRAAWARLFPSLAPRYRTLRICSNIPLLLSAAPAADLRRLGERVPACTILFFGTGHQSILFDYVEAAFVELSKIAPDAELVVVGMDSHKLAQLAPALAQYGERVRALGYVEAPRVSLWLQQAELVLAPLVEGVSARKGTVMAALQHGKSVVTTQGFHTCDDISWAEICVLSPLDRAAFAAAAVHAFRDPALRAAVGRSAHDEYAAHASPEVTAAKIMELAAARSVR